MNFLNMRKILTFPTWVLVLLLRPFLKKGHLLKRKLTLDDWSQHSTPLNDLLSSYFWFNTLSIIGVLLYLIFK